MTTDMATTPSQLSTNNGHNESTDREASRDPANAASESLDVDEADDSDLDSVFNHDDDIADGLDSDGQPDIARNYNRQRPLNANQQKPAANTAANIDDQIAALSKHAGKIRLDDVKEGQDREKDKSDRATSDQVLDRRTRMILYQMINRDVVSEIHGAISTGKEANVYGAVAHPDPNGPPVQRAIKVYKTAILSFKDRERYITGEYRFKSGAEKGNNRKMVKLWAEKEFRNLRRIHSAAIPCPEPIQLKLHVLVMGFLGDKKGYAYPRLRDANIADEDADQVWRQLYIQLLGIMRRLYQVCKLVHADLSEYNILYNDKQLYIIDVSQSVEHDHPRSLEFLRMDVKNTGDFFRRKGVDTLPDRVIFDFITNSQGAVEEPGVSDAIEQLYTSSLSSNNETAAKQEVDNEVFRNQYIPQTLQQVYDIEKDAQVIGEGEGDKLVYRNLLADQVVAKPEEEEASSDDESGDGATLENDSGSDDESAFAKGPPRGKRFQDKEAKKQHKHAVKEAKAEKRKEKMPKHVKKRLVSTSSRRNK
ncbi:Serine/threonine-protein kinase Rio1 [Annulohypoxylon maeteangense]|uniref:Serine/threonine-protein kinase Rio1 n=1 Tax=Annulohypoxylon maeteangense TaxID=1927788 RepID=UPI002007D5AD|nr:Serine/threonine-protein kinase Rio1 [Annulohypoxylon maeteangense]KAI0887106.1 Serine/threonine-protein kinase Rio1 [Annulohypoxylon maeteangense]